MLFCAVKNTINFQAKGTAISSEVIPYINKGATFGMEVKPIPVNLIGSDSGSIAFGSTSITFAGILYKFGGILYKIPVNLYKIPVNLYKIPVNLYKIPVNLYKIRLNLYKIPVNLYKIEQNLYKIPPNLYKIQEKVMKSGFYPIQYGLRAIINSLSLLVIKSRLVIIDENRFGIVNKQIK